MTPDDVEALLQSLARTMEHQRSINDDLRAIAANHEGRMRYAEETLRLVKDILERFNGR
jgi:hypothetical protein